MNKKSVWIGLAIVAAILVTTVGVAFAAEQTTSANGCGLGLKIGRSSSGGGVLQNVAKILNLDQNELLDERQDGKSFADIAKEKGQDPEKLAEGVMEARKAGVQEMVEDGTITQEQADSCLERMEDRVRTRLESDTCGPNGKGQGGRGNGGGGQGKALAE